MRVPHHVTCACGPCRARREQYAGIDVALALDEAFGGVLRENVGDRLAKAMAERDMLRTEVEDQERALAAERAAEGER